MTSSPTPTLSPKGGEAWDRSHRRGGEFYIGDFGEFYVGVDIPPLLGRRHVKVTARRTKVDFAYFLRDLVDVRFPDAEVIDVAVENLNTHFTSLAL